MPITHILVIVDDEEGIDNMIDVLSQINDVGDAQLMVTNTLQGAINVLTSDCETVTFGRKLNG